MNLSFSSHWQAHANPLTSWELHAEGDIDIDHSFIHLYDPCTQSE